MMTKKEIRKQVLDERRALDEESAILASQVICRKVMGLPAYDEAENICLYVPVNNEVDVMLLADEAESAGKKVWLPKVNGEDMDFRAYEGEDRLEEGAYHIPEPVSDEMLEDFANALVIMPGAVFTPERDRIGYGGGYYDRFLEGAEGCTTVAVCYDFQIADEIPVEEHDIRPDFLVSDISIFG